MRKTIFGLLLSLLSTIALSQSSYQTKEIKITYSNAVEVFNVCVNNPTFTYDDKEEYFWYTEFSKIKSTWGGTGGKLLHGNYKLYNENGSLIADYNYFLGLKNGVFKQWDSVGNITRTEKYEKGKLVYMKFLNDGYWIEHTGDFGLEGWIKKVYTQWGVLVEETKGLQGFFNCHTKQFYEFSGKIKQEFYTDDKRFYGKRISYFEDGKIESEVQYCEDSPVEIRTGIWKWYNSDGTLDSQEEYKAEVIKWENGKYKSAGGYILDNNSNQWLRTGEWKWYKETGEFESSKKYESGVEVVQ